VVLFILSNSHFEVDGLFANEFLLFSLLLPSSISAESQPDNRDEEKKAEENEGLQSVAALLCC
jgi:hypothetical protein